MKKITQKIWYHSLKNVLKLGLFFTLKKLIVKGAENIPKKGPVVFIGNHQNAFIDAIIIPTTNNRETHFLTRSNVFKNRHIARFLKWCNMLPVYRMRDGANTVKKNHKIFESCHDILGEGKALQIFGEGMHHLDRKVYPMKKGFARIIHGTLERYPDLDIKIVPVGINYDHHIKFPASASVVYGEPISANNYIDLKNPDVRYQELKTKVREGLKKLTLHIDETENYETVIDQIEQLNIDYLDPKKAYKTYNQRNDLKAIATSIKRNWLYKITYPFWKLNSMIPLFLWKQASKSVKEIIFTQTFRFAFVVVVFPLFYLLQALIVGYAFSYQTAFYYVIGTVILSIITVKKDLIPATVRPE